MSMGGPQRNALLNKQGRLSWLGSLPEENIRALAQQWSITRWKEIDIGVLKAMLSQIEGVEVPIGTQRYVK